MLSRALPIATGASGAVIAYSLSTKSKSSVSFFNQKKFPLTFPSLNSCFPFLIAPIPFPSSLHIIALH